MWDKIQQISQKRIKAALCTIVEAKGSTPRKEGSKLLVTEDGQFFGTVGGGNLEYAVIEKAKHVISTQKPMLLKNNLTKDFNMACGGQVTIFIEPVIPKNQLILFGAGHIAKALATFARHLDFDIIVIDPRKNVINSWNLKENITFVNEDFETAFEKLSFDNQTYICSLAFTHDLDLKVAALALKREFAYLGVIASKNKARKIANKLINEYGFQQEDVDKIDMPMGVPINCETPEEIAISILAKIIDIKNSKNDIRQDSTEISVQTASYTANSNK